MRAQIFALSVFGVVTWWLIFMRLQGGFVEIKENAVKSMRGSKHEHFYVISLSGVPGSSVQNKDRLQRFEEYFLNTCNMRFHVCNGYVDHRRGFGLTKGFIECFKTASAHGAKYNYFFEDDARLFTTDFCQQKYRKKIQDSKPNDTGILLLGGHHWDIDGDDSGAFVKLSGSYGSYGFSVSIDKIQPFIDGFERNYALKKQMISPDVFIYDITKKMKTHVYAIQPLVVSHPAGWSNTWNKHRTAIDKRMIKKHPSITKHDRIMRNGWNYSPIVIEKYKLLLFAIPKNACTVIKQLARRLMGIKDWKIVDGIIPHDPLKNGLKYLHSYPIQKATQMMTSPDWTRAIFLRDPHTRILSAYLEKAVKHDYVKRTCGRQPENFSSFVSMISRCKDAHWSSQKSFIDDKWWPYINFKGHITTAARDMKELLQQKGLWQQFGSNGWYHGAIFEENGAKHSTNAKNRINKYYDDEIRIKISIMYAEDIEMLNGEHAKTDIQSIRGTVKDLEFITTHKWGHELTQSIIRNHFKGSTFKQRIKSANNKTVVMARNVYNSIISGYLYHKSGKECWLNHYGEPNNKTRYRNDWLLRVKINGYTKNLCEILRDEPEERGLGVYAKFAWTRFIRSAMNVYKSNIPFLRLCMEDTLKDYDATVRKIMNFAGYSPSDMMYTMEIPNEGHSTNRDKNLRQRLYNMIRKIDSSDMDSQLREAQELIQCGDIHPKTCYYAERHAPLHGKWVDASYTFHQTYTNMSCPLEWSKYSCVHQGAPQHAEVSAKRHFNTDCLLLHPHRDHLVYRKGRTIYFVGDSLIRQMFIAMACMLGSHVRSYDANWPTCGEEQWPCHNTKNCIRCGPNSGFHTATVILETGASLRFTNTVRNVLHEDDVVFMESGVHTHKSSENTERLLNLTYLRIKQANAKLIWVITPQDAFKSKDKTGRYDPNYLRQGNTGCEKHVTPTRANAEWPVLQMHKTMLDGIIDFTQIADQGDAKVGAGVGTFGDCQHYCMPGIPDIYASAMYTMMRNIDSQALNT